jgi:hypothetical protein
VRRKWKGENVMTHLNHAYLLRVKDLRPSGSLYSTADGSQKALRYTIQSDLKSAGMGEHFDGYLYQVCYLVLVPRASRRLRWMQIRILQPFENEPRKVLHLFRNDRARNESRDEVGCAPSLFRLKGSGCELCTGLDPHSPAEAVRHDPRSQVDWIASRAHCDHGTE